MPFFTQKTTKVTVVPEGAGFNWPGLVSKVREGFWRDILCLIWFILLHMTKWVVVKIFQVETPNQCSKFCPASLASAFLWHVGRGKETKWCRSSLAVWGCDRYGDVFISVIPNFQCTNYKWRTPPGNRTDGQERTSEAWYGKPDCPLT